MYRCRWCNSRRHCDLLKFRWGQCSKLESDPLSQIERCTTGEPPKSNVGYRQLFVVTCDSDSLQARVAILLTPFHDFIPFDVSDFLRVNGDVSRSSSSTIGKCIR